MDIWKYSGSQCQETNFQELDGAELPKQDIEMGRADDGKDFEKELKRWSSRTKRLRRGNKFWTSCKTPSSPFHKTLRM